MSIFFVYFVVLGSFEVAFYIGIPRYISCDWWAMKESPVGWLVHCIILLLASQRTLPHEQPVFPCCYGTSTCTNVEIYGVNSFREETDGPMCSPTASPTAQRHCCILTWAVGIWLNSSDHTYFLLFSFGAFIILGDLKSHSRQFHSFFSLKVAPSQSLRQPTSHSLLEDLGIFRFYRP